MLRGILVVTLTFIISAAGAQQTGTQLRDPTKPVYVQEQAEGDLKLNAVMIGSGKNKRSSAIINHKALKVGEYIQNYKVIAIRRNYVILQDGKQRKKLSMDGSKEAVNKEFK